MIVSPFLFNRKTKSDLGWAFVGLIDGGRIKEYADDGADITRIYRHQLAACTYEVLPGPGKLLRWSVPASRGLLAVAIRSIPVVSRGGRAAKAKPADLVGQNPPLALRERPAHSPWCPRQGRFHVPPVFTFKQE